jgi:hypothetical protein
VSESVHHQTVKQGIADRIKTIQESAGEEQSDDLFIEKGLEADSGGGIADVRFDRPHQGFQGFAIEIKSRCSQRERTRSIFQLTGYLRAGYHPVLVAPTAFYDSEPVELVPGHHKLRYKDIAKSLNADIVDVTNGREVTFSPVSPYQYDSIKGLLFDRGE